MPTLVAIPAGDSAWVTSDEGIERLLEQRNEAEWVTDRKQKKQFDDEQPAQRQDMEPCR
jgi:hypothetical protein